MVGCLGGCSCTFIRTHQPLAHGDNTENESLRVLEKLLLGLICSSSEVCARKYLKHIP